MVTSSRIREGFVDAASAVQHLLTAEGRRDPYVAYDALRAHGPLVEVGDGFFAATGYAIADAILRHPRLLVEDARYLATVAPGWEPGSAVRSLNRSILSTNAPDHGRMRRLMTAAFTPRRLAALRATVEGIATGLADSLAGHGGTPVDFVRAFAYPLPVRVICALLGVPMRDHPWFRVRADELTAVLELQIGVVDLAAADRAAEELQGYFAGLVRERRAAPADDLTTALVHARDAGDALDDDELLANLMLLLVAGFETTTNLLGNGLVALLGHPDQAHRLRADAGRAPAVVREVLRYESPVQLTSRWCAGPVEVAAHALPAGATVLVLLGAANRDPSRFEQPDLFRPDRPDNQPLSFGAGAHYCLGAALARLEAEVAFPLLLRRRPGLELAGEPEWTDRLTLRGYASLPVR